MPNYAPLVWDEVGKKTYETGTKRGVLFPMNDQGAYGDGVAWSGLTAVNESNTGAEETSLWADDIKYASLRSAQEFGFTIEAYQCPDEFYACDGSAELIPGVTVNQQARRSFGFSYTTTIGNDVVGNDYGEKIHLVYNATASPSERAYQTINDSPEGMTLSWECTTTPVAVTGHKPTAHVIIDTTKVDSTKLTAFKAILYGSATANSRLPLPDEVASLLAA